MSKDADTKPAKAKTVTACLIVIGNEILSGRTQDRNLAYLAEWLNGLGVRLGEARVIPDIESVIVDTVNDCRARFDYVFTTGGIGPTHDDITSASVAKAFGVAVERHPDAARLLEAHYEPADRTAARMKMADVPAGATLIDNPISKAPGFQLGNVFVLAGVPAIMRAMLDSVRHRIAGGAPVASRQVVCFLAEGEVAAGLAEIQARYPDIDIGSYPFWKMRRFGVSLVLRGTDEAELDAAAEAVRDLVRSLGGEPMDGEPGE